ncbi:MAG: ATPase [Rhodobacteraceae bacterium]|nr:ATPase [Paracoccaceae bacterium]
MSYLIGVDGGGTGCRVILADMSGHVVGSAKGGAANIATNLAKARANILAAIDLAFDNAGINRAEIANSSAVLGLAGSNFGSYAADLRVNLPLKNNHIVNDSRITLEGAIGAVDGCIAAIGTGSVFAARDAEGVRMLGGWGFLLGDDGSGAALGRDMLKLTILAADGMRPHSELTRETLDQFGGRIEAIVETAGTYTPRDFGQFAPRIVAAAAAGDEHGVALMAHHSALVRDSIDAVGFNPDKPFCILGGLGPIYLKTLPEKYQNAVHPPKGNALSGALAMAKRRFGDA